MYLCGKIPKIFKTLKLHCLCFADENQTRALLNGNIHKFAVRMMKMMMIFQENTSILYSSDTIFLMYIMKGIYFCWVVIRFQFICDFFFQLENILNNAQPIHEMANKYKHKQAKYNTELEGLIQWIYFTRSCIIIKYCYQPFHLILICENLLYRIDASMKSL